MNPSRWAPDDSGVFFMFMGVDVVRDSVYTWFKHFNIRLFIVASFIDTG